MSWDFVLSWSEQRIALVLYRFTGKSLPDHDLTSRTKVLTPKKSATTNGSEIGGRERFTAASRPGPRLVGGLSEGCGALQDVVSSLAQLTHWPKAA